MGKNKKKANSQRESTADERNVRDDKIEMQGVVVEALPGTLFKVETEGGMTVLCTLSGKLRMNRINILPSDKVMIEVTPYDPGRGRISWRLPS